MRTIMYLGIIIISIALVVNCEKSSERDKLEDATQKMEEAAKDMAEAGKMVAEGLKKSGEDVSEGMKKMSKALISGQKVEVVDFRELKKLLPGKLHGMKRISAVGEKTGMFGIKVSEAKAEYESDDGANITIRITDFGGLKSVAAAAKLGWTMREIDRETDTGYERTFRYKDHPAWEKYDDRSKDGEIKAFVAGRFVVEVEGSDVKMKDLKKAFGEINIRKLEKMKDYGVKD